MGFFLASCSAVNTISVVLLFIRSKRYNIDKAERNMLILALLDFFIETAFFALYAVIFTNSKRHSFVYSLVPYASDLITFSNAYLLVILNKKVRERISHMIKCKGEVAH
ncbi:hypothetical protein ANCDUO_08590 [Ancylostoma duodenale]|uniref:Serpentine receptor class gamma n=1 Tax=Ancylostoma duodenale TaxID=51022 RepID=A0A0C2GIV9_9BILA|nr:hypothetical protein ANCDUO_08590 [Ancylostoma duodenale]